MFNQRIFTEKNMNKMSNFLEYLFNRKIEYMVSYWADKDKTIVVVRFGE